MQSKDEDALERNRANALAGLKSIDWFVQKELVGVQAKGAFMKYRAAIKEGFTEAQALEICIKPWAL